MTEVSATEVRAFVLAELDAPLRASALATTEIADDFDLHEAGVIDSLGLLELITAVEDHFGLEIDFEELDPEDLGVVGPFCRFVELQSRQGAPS